MPLIEEFNFEEIFSQDQIDCIVRGKRRKLDSIQNIYSCMDLSTTDNSLNLNSSEYGAQSLSEEERSILK